jgi:SPP1 gp7 family putative phage head morphogenesis protein
MHGLLPNHPMKKLLPAIVHRDEYTRGLEKVIRAYFDEVIFGPVLEILETANIRENATATAVQTALRTGVIYYADGAFRGRFSAAISRELRAMGATFDTRADAFVIPVGKLPGELHGAAMGSIQRAQDVHRQIATTLAEAEANVQIATTGIEVDQVLGRIRGDLWRQMESSVSGLDFVSVPADMTPEISATLAKEFTQNLELEIKNFLSHEIPELRAQVEANALSGARPDRLAKIIGDRYGVTKRKAAFLAEQESSLYVSKFREERYRSIGSMRYVWSTSHDERVRADHRGLNGKTFAWDSPPVSNRKSGARNHPGEDFRCRCVAIPVLEIEELAAAAARES